MKTFLVGVYFYLPFNLAWQVSKYSFFRYDLTERFSKGKKI